MRTLILALLLGATGLHAASPAVPLETFFSLPTIREPALSPDGTKIAFLFPKDDKLTLGLFDRKTNEGRMILEGSNDNVDHFQWKGDDQIVFWGDIGGNRQFFVGVTDLHGKRVKRIVDSGYGYLITALPESEDDIIIAAYNTQYKVYRHDVRKKTERMIFVNGEGYEGFTVDKQGHVRLAYHKRAKDRVWHHRSAASDGPLREIKRVPINGYAETWKPISFDPDGRVLYVLSRETNDLGDLVVYDTETMSENPTPVFSPKSGELQGLVYDGARKTVLGVSYRDDRLRYHWFDKARAELQATLENTFKGFACHIESTSSDNQTHLVWVGSDRDPGTYYILDLKKPEIALFKRVRPDIDPALMRPMEAIKFTARDGLVIHGYLTRPAGTDSRRLPMVIIPHDGPYDRRDTWGYREEVQFLASRGYVVLQVNYRGSGGYGREFLNKGRRQWGRAMQDDLTDAVKWAVADGIADPDRVAIYGTGYGGYAAMAGVAFTPSLYRCAINRSGLVDIRIAFKGLGGDAYIRPGDFDYQREWIAPNAEYAKEISPIAHADKIVAPTLHAYRERDTEVEIQHWINLEGALKRHGKKYEALLEKRADAGYQNERASIAFYRKLEQFLATHLQSNN